MRSLLDAGREYSTAAVLFHGAVAERFGLGVTDLKALDLLQRRGPLAAGEIAAETGLASASVTSLIDRLERKRLARRLRDPEDRRRVIVSLTPRVEEAIVPLFESLSRRMLARFRSYDDRLIGSIREFLIRGAREMREETARLTGAGA